MNKPTSTLIDPPASPAPPSVPPPSEPLHLATPVAGTYEACQQCGAPLDRRQRYCVSCGSRRGDTTNPASRYFAAASHRRRQGGAVAGRPVSAQPQASSARTAAVFFFILLPIAVAVGVLVGRGGSDTDNAALLAALKQSGATASTAAGAAATDASNTSSNLLPSDFSLDKGYTVLIGQLPIDGTDQAAADTAKSDAEGKGAKDVGIINPGDFVTKPDQGQDSYVVYSGEFKTKGDAEKALTGLKKDFPDAKVIGVTAGGSSAGGSTSGGSADAGHVVAQTQHGDVHQVSGLAPSDEQVQQDTETVNHIADQTGADYTNQQQQLPDVISIGGNPDDAPPLPTGAGD
jgi:SPOR domain